MNPQLPAPRRSRIPRVLFAAIAIALCALSTFALIQAGVFYFLYTSLFGRVTRARMLPPNPAPMMRAP